ncbi:MAG: hypothetical protein ABI955_09665, partial [Nitrospirota bacterium]
TRRRKPPNSKRLLPDGTHHASSPPSKTKSKDTVMKTKSNLLNRIRTVQQPSWLRPALITLALAAAILGGSGCSPSDDNKDSHDSNHPGNHGNHGNHMN